MASYWTKAVHRVSLVVLVLLCGMPVSAGAEPALDLRQLITDAGMMPWTSRPMSLDEPLRRGLNREPVPLRSFVSGGKPLLVYQYGYW